MISLLILPIIGLSIIVGTAYLYFRWDWKTVVVIFPILISLLVFNGEVGDTPFFIGPYFVGIIGGYALKKGRSFKFYILVSSFGLALLFTGTFYYMLFVQNIDFFGLLKEEMARFLNIAKAPEDIKGRFLSDIDKSKDYLLGGVPFSSFANSLVLSGIGYLLMKRFFSRFMEGSTVEGIEFFRINEYLIFPFIIGWALFLLIDKSGYTVLYFIGLNAGVIISFLYCLQALGVIKYFFIRRGLPSYLLPLAVLLVFISGIWIAFFVFILLTGFGTLDLWADFRKLNLKEDNIEK